MTVGEYEDALAALTDAEFNDLQHRFGGHQHRTRNRKQLVQEFAANPHMERPLCLHLGLKTEAEKLTEAALSMARLAVVVSLVALLIAVVALFVGRGS